eukprot:Gb_39296 [translate_table: standard]
MEKPLSTRRLQSPVKQSFTRGEITTARPPTPTRRTSNTQDNGRIALSRNPNHDLTDFSGRDSEHAGGQTYETKREVTFLDDEYKTNQDHDSSCPEDFEEEEEIPVAPRKYNDEGTRHPNNDDNHDNGKGHLSKKPETGKQFSIQTRYIEWREQKYTPRQSYDDSNEEGTDVVDDDAEHEEMEEAVSRCSSSSEESRCTTPVKSRNNKTPVSARSNSPVRNINSYTTDNAPSKNRNFDREIERIENLPKKIEKNGRNERRNSKHVGENEPEIKESLLRSRNSNNDEENGGETVEFSRRKNSKNDGDVELELKEFRRKSSKFYGDNDLEYEKFLRRKISKGSVENEQEYTDLLQKKNSKNYDDKELENKELLQRKNSNSAPGIAARRSILKPSVSNRSARSISVGPESKPSRSGKATDSFSINSARRESSARTPVDRKENGSMRKFSSVNDRNGKDCSKKNSETRPLSRQPNNRNSAPIQNSQAHSEGNGQSTAREQYQSEQMENLKEERDRAEAERGRMEQQVLNLIDRSFQREKELENICSDRDKRLEEMNSLKEELDIWKNKCVNLEEVSRKLQETKNRKTFGVEAIPEENAKWTKLLQSKQIELNSLKAGQKMVTSSLLATKSRVFDLRKRLKTNHEKFRRLTCGNGEKQRENETEYNSDAGELKDEELPRKFIGQDDKTFEDVQALAMDLEAEVLGLIEEARAREQNLEKEKFEVNRQNENLLKENELMEGKMEKMKSAMENVMQSTKQMDSVIAEKSNKMEQLTRELESKLNAEAQVKKLQDDLLRLTNELQKERKEKQKVTNMYFTAVNELNVKDRKRREDMDVLVKKSHERKDKKEENKGIEEPDGVSQILHEYRLENAKKEEEIVRLMGQMAVLEEELKEVKMRSDMINRGGFIRDNSYDDKLSRPRRSNQYHEEKSEVIDSLDNIDPRKEELLVNLRKRIHEAASLITESYDASHSKRNEGMRSWLDGRKFTERHQWEQEFQRLLDGKYSKTAESLRALSAVVQELESCL